MAMFGPEQITAFIPQRPPFLFLDEVSAFEPEQRATGILHLTGGFLGA
jgi:3-hydroxymyristoyl/3-hydroxydecanoyl-(acyl carrier protein) dehydratase